MEHKNEKKKGSFREGTRVLLSRDPTLSLLISKRGITANSCAAFAGAILRMDAYEARVKIRHLYPKSVPSYCHLLEPFRCWLGI